VKSLKLKTSHEPHFHHSLTCQHCLVAFFKKAVLQITNTLINFGKAPLVRSKIRIISLQPQNFSFNKIANQALIAKIAQDLS